MLHNMISGKPIDLARNVMVTKALQDKCEYIFFLDSDILVNPDTLTKLFIGNMPIISGVYYSRAPPYEMVAQIGGRGLSHELAGKDERRCGFMWQRSWTTNGGLSLCERLSELQEEDIQVLLSG
jgi:hypothetical protein